MLSTSEVHSTRKTGSENICRNAAPHAVWLVEREKGKRGKQALCMQANFSVSTEKQSELKAGSPTAADRAQSRDF